MDLDSIEGLNEIRPSVYRVSIKLQHLQRLCHLDRVSVRHVRAAVQSVMRADCQQEVTLSRQEVTQALNKMFVSVSQEVRGHVTLVVQEETSRLMFTLYDPFASGFISVVSLQTALIALSAGTLQEKYRGLVSVRGSGPVSRSALRCLLQDLSQVPAAVQEHSVFGGVEAAVCSCFRGVLTRSVGEEHVISWLQSEPQLLLWLPTLYRLTVAQSISHNVRCHTCKSRPIRGLRYRCMKCLNVQVCQNCFLTDRHTKKHKREHPVMEYCRQPTWKESLSSLVHSARCAMLPRRLSQRDRGRGLLWEEPEENSAPPPSLTSTVSHWDVSHDASAVNHRDVSHDASAVNHRDVSHDASAVNHRDVSHDASAVNHRDSSHDASAVNHRDSSHDASVRQTEEGTSNQVSSGDIMALQQQLQQWRLTVQSEQSVLQDRCAEVEVTMVTLREHNLQLQDMLTQTLNKMEDHQRVNMENIEDMKNTDNENEENMENTEGNIVKEEEVRDDVSEEDHQTPTPIMHQETSPSLSEWEDSAGDWFLCRPYGNQEEDKEVEPQEDNNSVSEEEEGHGTCSPEGGLQEVIDRLKVIMQTDRWTERHTGERKAAELVAAAGQVGECVVQLVEAVTTH